MVTKTPVAVVVCGVCCFARAPHTLAQCACYVQAVDVVFNSWVLTRIESEDPREDDFKKQVRAAESNSYIYSVWERA